MTKKLSTTRQVNSKTSSILDDSGSESEQHQPSNKIKESKQDSSPIFKSRFQRTAVDEALRRVQSHFGGDSDLILTKRQSSPFKRFPHLTGKQVRHMQTLKTWQRLYDATDVIGTASQVETLHCQRKTFEAKIKRKAGGPHDLEFFNCLR